MMFVLKVNVTLTVSLHRLKLCWCYGW